MKMEGFDGENQACDFRNEFAVSASGIGVWDWNLISYEIYYSPESLKILELNHDETIYMSPEQWFEKVHPDDREYYSKTINVHIDSKNSHYEACYRVLCNETYKWILIRGKVVSLDADNNPTRIIGTHTDISNQKDSEQDLLETLNLVRSQKNSLLNFAQIVSHNLRNHVGNLSSILQLNEDGLFENDEFSEYLKSVSEELTSSIENLMELVEIKSNFEIKKNILNVNVFIERINKILIESFRKNKTEIINLVPDDFNVFFNSAYLESVLLNLTSNAIKYADSSKKSYVKFYVEPDDSNKILVIEDNGLGIDLEKYNDEIFGLYKTFHSNEDSKGVGLHITKNQIEAMNGKIEVSSEIGVGTVFKIYFK